MIANTVTYLSLTVILVSYAAEGVSGSRSESRKRSFDNDDFHFGTASKEDEIINMYLHADKYSNLTYREEYCKAKNWSIEFGW